MHKALKPISKSLLRLTITFIIIVLISFIPSIYQFTYEYWRITGLEIDGANYFNNIQNYFNHLKEGELGYYNLSNPYDYSDEDTKGKRAISKDILIYYKTTLQTFIPAVVFGILFGIIGAALTFLIKEKWRSIPKIISFFLVSIPDFFLIMLLQFIIIWVYKETGVKIANVATGGSSEAVFMPIFTLGLFPFAFVYRTTLNSFEDTFTNKYIQTAYSKGLNKLKILRSHVTKNSLLITLNNLPSIIMPVISNLFIVEYMYNTHGITNLVFNHYTNLNVLVISVFLLWIMVETILIINDIIIKILTRHKGDSYA